MIWKTSRKLVFFELFSIEVLEQILSWLAASQVLE